MATSCAVLIGRVVLEEKPIEMRVTKKLVAIKDKKGNKRRANYTRGRKIFLVFFFDF